MLLSQSHRILHSYKIFVYFTWFTRILLAIAFLPSGLKKILGQRFTALGIDNPVGFFFEALYRSGFYWNFLGFVQFLVAALLVIPRTATLGALLYLPFVINIFIGTPIVTGLMLLANLYLLLWDYPKILQLTKVVLAKS